MATMGGPGRRSRRRPGGFTLIELMIVVAIIAILLTLAVGGYTRYVERARRADAKQALEDTAQRLERCYTQYGAYNDGNCGIFSDISGGSSIDSPEGHYTITTSSSGATSYTIQAAPKGTGAQSDDACGTFELSHTGVKSSDGGSSDKCWR